MSLWASGLLQDATEYAALVFLGLWERQTRVVLRERQLDQALRLGLGNNAIDEARRASDRSRVALISGRELDRREQALLCDLQASGATQLELWLLFSSHAIRTGRKEIKTGWRWIEWLAFVTVAVAASSLILPVVFILTENAARGITPNWPLLSVFLVGIGLHCWVWDLYLTEPLRILKKWNAVIDIHRVAGASA